MENNNTDDAVDLSPLESHHDPSREDRVVAAVMARVRQADPPGITEMIFYQVTRVRWAALAAAAAITAIVAIQRPEGTPEVLPFESAALASTIGVPGQWVEMMTTDELPDAETVVAQLGVQ